MKIAPMRIRILLSIAGLSTLMASPSHAQSDINFAAPNVLLLVDTSGSMEYQTTSATQTSQVASPICVPTAATRTDGQDKTRWINVVEVLGGTIPNYHCQPISRTTIGSDFDEYKLSSTQRPPDFGYPIAYHRPMSGTCVRGPGVYSTSQPFAPLDLTAFPTSPKSKSFADHVYNSTSTSCTFTQNNDGILSAFSGYVRFGLMTFDTLTNEGTGSSGQTYLGSSANLSTGVQGSWSYYYGSSAVGRPAGCITQPTAFEVGARNPAAPPWEGRMVAFGAPDPSGSNTPANRGEWIRNILLTTRPFGGTPIAGMLADAKTFLLTDARKDPVFGTSTNDSKDDFGPYRDPYVTGGCRKNFIVLLTDGEPNLELRPECVGAGGACPYSTPYDIASELYVNYGVTTFVVGFAVSKVTLASGESLDCRNINQTNIDSICSNNTDPKVQVCCTLDRIALNGSGNSDHAYFADSPSELRAALSAIFSKVSTGTTSRTWPVTASASTLTNATNGVAGYRFYTSFVPKANLGKYGTLWSGVIERQRYVCKTPAGGGVPEATLEDAKQSAGDSFADNVNLDGSSVSKRRYYTFIGTNNNGTVNSVGFIRPNLTADDGAGLYAGTHVRAASASALPSTTDLAPAMQVTNATCASDTPALTTAATCAARRMNWLVGGIDSSTNYNRCSIPGTTDCNLIADVLHSTPVVVDRPADAPRDQTYQSFANAWRERPLVLYTSTNDGMLHAFKVASNYDSTHTDSMPVTSLANNELWAFIPPAVLPKIDSQWPGSHQELLDGAPVTANVVASPVSTGTTTYADDGSARYKFERTTGDFAAAVTSDTTKSDPSKTTWRTVLLQGLNNIQGGYFALDITNPEPPGVNVPYSAGTLSPGPRFLWQLTDAPSAAQRMFGPRSATPLITTLFFAPSSTEAAREIAVAVLPGGYADPDDYSTSVPRTTPIPATVDSNFPARTSIAKYTTSNAVAARSLTIVRLDTGEIVRTFRQKKTEVTTNLQTRVIESPLDSPITGQPVAYPALAGAVADRIFVGDRDGALWRVNVASSDPSKWTMSMFFDAYSGQSAFSGQPVVTQPQLSIDSQGRVTVAFATGRQDLFAATGTTYVWSLLEDVSASSFKSVANWYRKFTNGEVPVGPLQLFASGLYFATYLPPQATTACGTGTSKIWGMNYLELDTAATASDGTITLSKGGKAWLPKGGDSNSLTKDNVQYLAADVSCTDTSQPASNNTDCDLAGASVFGVSVAQVPSCVDNSTTTDSFFATGTHTTLPNITPARYQLVMQTGKSGTPTQGRKTNVATIDLPRPNNAPRIASWASIME